MTVAQSIIRETMRFVTSALRLDIAALCPLQTTRDPPVGRGIPRKGHDHSG
jgi:hypothetical protein